MTKYRGIKASLKQQLKEHGVTKVTLASGRQVTLSSAKTIDLQKTLENLK